ncbi:hypothetical protein pah_c253o015 [Parachlamydia acanthamoebae str. Hall's coccus]|nr:hypothetical protein pah_c253o015 [Parachlamydia acanthamoebae str. Hall's coccus]
MQKPTFLNILAILSALLMPSSDRAVASELLQRPVSVCFDILGSI